jgi:hypothetical protein
MVLEDSRKQGEENKKKKKKNDILMHVCTESEWRQVSYTFHLNTSSLSPTFPSHCRVGRLFLFLLFAAKGCWCCGGLGFSVLLRSDFDFQLFA